jgi:hypothetical protein
MSNDDFRLNTLESERKLSIPFCFVLSFQSTVRRSIIMAMSFPYGLDAC